MGEATKRFCDGCKKEIIPTKWSQGTESGEIHNYIQRWSEGADTTGEKGELCDTCNEKIKTWLSAMLNAAASDWSVTPPEAVTITPPKL